MNVTKSEEGGCPREFLPEEQERIVRSVLDWSDSIPFELAYRTATKYKDKYAFAVALLGSHEYTQRYNPMFLYDDFAQTGAFLTPEEQWMQGNIQLLLVEGGFIDPNAADVHDAESAVACIVEENDVLASLRGMLPIHVMGALTNALVFHDATDGERLERMRSFTTRALLRPYLGDLEVYRSIGSVELRDVLDVVPEGIFRDETSATAGIVRDYIIGQAMNLFIDSEDEGFTALEALINQETSDLKEAVLREVYDEFQAIAHLKIPSAFRESVPGWFTEKSPFPLFRQKYFVHEFLKTCRILLNGDTGATKTACSYLAMETIAAKSNGVQAQKVTIIGPAKARNTWPREANKIFDDNHKPDVFAISSIKDLSDTRAISARYVYIGTEFLASAWGEKSFQKISDLLINKRSTDAIILDESDEIRNPKTNTAQAVSHIVQKVKETHSVGVGTVPILALTATPIASELSDLDTTMALLYPRFDYPNSKMGVAGGFSNKVLKDPHIAYSVLFGEKLMMQWTLADLFGEKTSHLEYKRVRLQLAPAERVIYDYMNGLPFSVLGKVGLLRSALLNPNLVIPTLQKHDLIPDPVYSQTDMVGRLHELHAAWQQWRSSMSAADWEVLGRPFSANWIAEYGETDLLVQCFFDENLVSGIDSLVGGQEDINGDWQSTEAVSAKYSYLKQFLQERFSKGASSEKVFIVSPHLKRGITRDGTKAAASDIDGDALSLFEHMDIDWLEGLPDGSVVNIDGQKSFVARDRAAKKWREKGYENLVVVASMGSVDESMDWAIRNTSDNQNIERATVIFLGWPWGWDEFKQMTGRFIRPGQAKTVDFLVLEADGTIDHGMRDLVRRKHLLMQMALAGVQLSNNDQRFFDRASKAQRVILGDIPVGQTFIRDTIRALEGRGAMVAMYEFGRMHDGVSYERHWAEHYFDEGRDRYRLVGNNARFVGQIVKQYINQLPDNEVVMADIGSGTCLFAREWLASRNSEKVVYMNNVDMNGEVLAIAKHHFPDIGNTIVAQAVDWDAEPESHDVVSSAFMLEWSQLVDESGKILGDPRGIERVQILQNISNMLKHKGLGIFTFPERVFDDATFMQFTQALESFGFTVVEPSGESYTVDTHPQRRIGWVITMQKTGDVDLSKLDTNQLRFLTDDRTSISIYELNDPGDVQTRVVQQGKGHPLFAAQQFRVQHPETQEDVVVDNNLTFDVLSKVFRLKYQLYERTQLPGWNAARKSVMGELKIDYVSAEKLLEAYCKKKDIDVQSDWSDTAFVENLVIEIVKANKKRRK